MPSHFRQELENWLKTLDIKAAKLLDVGGGQKPLPGRVKSFEVTDYKILDIGFGAEFIWDLNYKLNNSILNDLIKKNFDIVNVITCFEVMEYVFDPLQVLKNLNFLLAPRGELYISFPFIYPLHPPTGTDFLRYTKYGAHKLLKEAGFDIVENVPRKADNVGLWLDFLRADGFKYDKAEDYKALSETGCLIKAIKR